MRIVRKGGIFAEYLESAEKLRVFRRRTTRTKLYVLQMII